MAEDHPFTIKIEQHPGDMRRYRWAIYEDGRMRAQSSSSSFATIREAQADADKVMKVLVTKWRIRKNA